MPNIRFRGAYIRYADLRYENEGAPFIRLHVSADWTAPVREAMDWEEVPESVTSCKLEGALTAHNLILTPAGELSRHELQIACSDVSDFSLVRKKDEDGELKETELRFIARTQQAGAMALVESYIGVIGKGAALMKVSYEKQGALDLEEADVEEDKIEKPQQPALASAREMRPKGKPVGTKAGESVN